MFPPIITKISCPFWAECIWLAICYPCKRAAVKPYCSPVRNPGQTLNLGILPSHDRGNINVDKGRRWNSSINYFLDFAELKEGTERRRIFSQQAEKAVGMSGTEL